MGDVKIVKLLLNTCSIIWAISDPDSLSKDAASLLREENLKVYVSAISAAEIACASERGRIELNQHWKKWFRYYVELNHWHVESIDLNIVEAAYSLPESFHSDPADRIITATARLKSYTILTADNKILAYPYVKTL